MFNAIDVWGVIT